MIGLAKQYPILRPANGEHCTRRAEQRSAFRRISSHFFVRHGLVVECAALFHPTNPTAAAYCPSAFRFAALMIGHHFSTSAL